MKKHVHFQTDLYKLLQEVPVGFVTTYGDLAVALGDKNLARAVGNALHKNSDPKGVPCYRVVNAKGRLSDAYAFGGLIAQKARLEAEGIVIDEKIVDLSKYRFCFPKK